MLKKKLLILCILILTVFLATAKKMEVQSVTAEQFQIPVLIGKSSNPIVQLTIKTTGNKKPLSLQQVKFNITASDRISDIETTGIRFTEDKPFLREGQIFGVDQKPAELVVINGEQPLKEGTNIFWISFRLKEDADLLNRVNAKCNSLTIEDHEFVPETRSIVENLRIGHALRQHLEEGVHTYRIPGLATTKNGTLIAVYDIRRNSASDLQEDIDVGMSRSTDGGTSWEPMKVIMDMEQWGNRPDVENGIGDPAVLVDQENNTIWVAALWTHGQLNQRAWVASGQGLEPHETGQLMLVKSEDDGLTWSDPMNITKQIKKPGWHLLLQGPGKGITMSDGTLVFPAQFKDEQQVPYSTIIWSKDQGKTWNIGTGAKSETTEAQVIELTNGDLMLNMRDNRNRKDKSESNGRSVYVTKDLGKNWIKHPTSNNALIEPTCMGSIIKEEFYIDGQLRNVVLFSNPDSKFRRERMTVKISYDDGKTWPVEYPLLLDEKNSRGYSCMTKIDDNHIGIVYEGSQADLTFQKIPVQDILQQHKGLNYIFKSGTGDYRIFRIPAIVTTKTGRLLAFAEGRVHGSSDTGDIDLVMKSSDDNGETWSDLKVIWNDGENVCGNPAPVVDRTNGHIHLLMTWNKGTDHEREIIAGSSEGTRKVFIARSEDNGESWSEPVEITSSTKQDNWTWYATGPCHGIQLQNGPQKGRLIIPCDHIEAETKKYFSHIIYSDDHGVSWNLGGTTPQDQVNECTIAELPDGRLILNMRNYDRSHRARKISYSLDGGASWSDIQPEPSLIEPICQASMYYHNELRKLYFTNPASSSGRNNMTLKCSSDDGNSWETLKVLNSGASAYSDITMLKDGNLGVLYEGGRVSPYEGIIFTPVPIE